MLEAIIGAWNSTAILTAINVFILFFAVGYFGSPLAAGVFKKRQDAITEERKKAMESMEKARELKAEYEAKLMAIDDETKQILEQAKKTAKHREENSLTKANEEAKRIISHANNEAELEKKRVNDEIKQEIIDASYVVAGKILSKNLDNAKQDELIDETLNGMGDGVWQS